MSTPAKYANEKQEPVDVSGDTDGFGSDVEGFTALIAEGKN
jgi:hypothetical protein